MKPEVIPKLRRISMPIPSGRDAIVTSLAARFDASMMRAVTFIVERQLLPGAAVLETLQESIATMVNADFIDDPAEFFSFVGALESDLPKEDWDTRTYDGRLISGGKIYRRRLDSQYQSFRFFPDHEKQPFEESRDEILFEHWVHRERQASATVILLHGFAMGWHAIDGLALGAREWYDRGLDVVLLTLPDHGARSPKGARFSGQSYTTPHAVQLAAAVRRAVHEIFELKRWLRARSSLPVGLLGMSLGGYLASLCAGLSEDFDFLIPLVAPACMGDLAWRVYKGTQYHKSLSQDLICETSMRAAFYIHSPLAHQRKVAKERILIVAGAGDRIVPPEHPTALWEHWDQPAIHWLRGSHISPVGKSATKDVVSKHLQDLGLLRS